MFLTGALLCLVPASAIGAVDGAAPDPLGVAEAVELPTDPQAPRVLEAGLWRTDLPPNPSDPLQFRYERTSDDSTVHVSVTAVGGIQDGFELRSDVAGQDCGSASQSGGYDAAGAHVVIGGQIRVAGALDSACLNARTVDFELARAASAESDEQLPVVVKIVEETVLDDLYGVLNDDTDLPAPADTPPVLKMPTPKDPEVVTPGDGFDTAVDQGPGTYRATITQGENHFFAVELDWGQTVAARLDLPQVELPDEETSFYGPDLAVQVFNPMRNDIDASLDDVVPGVTLSAEEAVTATTGFGPVNWLQRFDRTAPLPGTHWVVVSMEGLGANDEGPPVATDYDLTLEVQGQRDGVPVYKGDVDPFLVGRDTRSAFASGHPRADEAGAEFWTGRRFGALGLGVFGVICVAAGGLRLRRQRAA